MATSFQVKGLKEALEKFHELPDEVKQEVDDELTATAYEIQNTARQLAPVDIGNLKNRIEVTRNDFEFKQVSALADYSAYVEFGTGTKVNIPALPPDLAAYAIQFKGRGIRKINMRAQPYFFPAYNAATKDLVKRLKDIIEDTAKKK